MKLAEGMNTGSAREPLLVVDLLPSRTGMPKLLGSFHC